MFNEGVQTTTLYTASRALRWRRQRRFCARVGCTCTTRRLGRAVVRIETICPRNRTRHAAGERAVAAASTALPVGNKQRNRSVY